MGKFIFGSGVGTLTEEQLLIKEKVAADNNCKFVFSRGTSQGYCQCVGKCQINQCNRLTWWFIGNQNGQRRDEELEDVVLLQCSNLEK